MLPTRPQNAYSLRQMLWWWLRQEGAASAREASASNFSRNCSNQCIKTKARTKKKNVSNRYKKCGNRFCFTLTTTSKRTYADSSQATIFAHFSKTISYAAFSTLSCALIVKLWVAASIMNWIAIRCGECCLYLKCTRSVYKLLFGTKEKLLATLHFGTSFAN